MFLDCPAYLGGDRAVRCGLPAEVEELYSVSSTDGRLACSPDYPAQLSAKARALVAAQKHQSLAACRAAELAIMRRNFTGPGEPYPRLRHAFVYKHKPAETPLHLNRHLTTAHAA